MKKLFSSTFAIVTSCAVLASISPISAIATEINEIPVDEQITEEVCLGDLGDLSLEYPQTPQAASNFGDDRYNFYDFLDENNAYVYQQLVELINSPTNEPVSIKLKEPVSVSVSALPSSDSFTTEDRENYELTLFGSCKPAIDSVMFDFPELCWLDVTKVAVRPGDDVSITRNFRRSSYTIKFSSIILTPEFYSCFETSDEAEEAMDELWEAVASFDVEGETRYEQLKSIHDQICTFTYYNMYSPLHGSALGALVTPGVVCEGYSKGFKLICDKLDIPCVVIYGNEDPETDSAHMWNYVQMEDGNWYGMDVTWDDLDGEGGKEIKYEYFLKGSRNFNRVHEEQPDYNITYLNYPVISKTDYSPATAVTTTTTTSTTTTSSTTTSTTTSKPTTTTTTSTTSATTTSTTTSAPTTTSTSKTTTSKTTSITTTKATTHSTTTSKTTSTTSATTTTSVPTTTTTKKTTSSTTTSTTISSTSAATTTSATTTTPTTTAPPELIGDLNKDGSVNIADLVYCASAVHGSSKPKNSCDANKDGMTDVFDVIFMRKVLIKLMK